MIHLISTFPSPSFFPCSKVTSLFCLPSPLLSWQGRQRGDSDPAYLPPPFLTMKPQINKSLNHSETYKMKIIYYICLPTVIIRIKSNGTTHIESLTSKGTDTYWALSRHLLPSPVVDTIVFTGTELSRGHKVEERSHVSLLNPP